MTTASMAIINPFQKLICHILSATQQGLLMQSQLQALHIAQLKISLPMESAITTAAMIIIKPLQQMQVPLLTSTEWAQTLPNINFMKLAWFSLEA